MSHNNAVQHPERTIAMPPETASSSLKRLQLDDNGVLNKKTRREPPPEGVSPEGRQTDLEDILASNFNLENATNPVPSTHNYIAEDLPARSQVNDNHVTGNNSTQVNAPIYNYDVNEGEKARDEKCLQDLRLTDPQGSMFTLESRNGTLIDGTYEWIFDDPAFRDLCDGNGKGRLLWINGEPGKGKTMLMIGLVKLMKERRAEKLLSFFFCQGMNLNLNTATAVLRGLVYSLVSPPNRKALLTHVRKRYDTAGSDLFRDENAFEALSDILRNILRDETYERYILMIDALDECESDLLMLLRFITKTQSDPDSKVKWILSSRNRPDIKQILRPRGSSSCSEMNLRDKSPQISLALNLFIDSKVRGLGEDYADNDLLKAEIATHLRNNAQGTFLWIALVCRELERVRAGKARNILRNSSPDGLDALYQTILDRITDTKKNQEPQLDEDEIKCCMEILSIVTVAFRPLSLSELSILVDLVGEDPQVDRLMSLEQLIDRCGSFISVHEKKVQFVHQSARDFFVGPIGSKIFSPLDQDGMQLRMATKCLNSMFKILRRDICNLSDPGILIDNGLPANVEKSICLSSLRYPCCFWVDHFQHLKSKVQLHQNLAPNGRVDGFLRRHLLHWLEALSLMRNPSKGAKMIKDLRSILREANSNCGVSSFLHDAERFLIKFFTIIQKAPLQLYFSALMFSPSQSTVRNCFLSEIPSYIKMLAPEEKWNHCLRILEGHESHVHDLQFSPDNRILASGTFCFFSMEIAVRFWDADTGGSKDVFDLIMNNDERRRLWGRGGCKNTGSRMAFSPCGGLFAAASDIRLYVWILKTRSLAYSVDARTNEIHSIAFSSGGQVLTCAFRHGCIHTIEATSGKVVKTLFCENNPFCENNLTLGDRGDRLKFYTPVTPQIAFCPTSDLLAITTSSFEIIFWDTTASESSWKVFPIYENVEFEIENVKDKNELLTYCVVFSPDGAYLACASQHGKTVIWDVRSEISIQARVTGSKLAISVNNLLATVGRGQGGALKLWSIPKGELRNTCIDSYDTAFADDFTYQGEMTEVAFSRDGELVASACKERVSLWGTKTGEMLKSFWTHGGYISSLAFSPNGKELVSGSKDYTIKVWDITSQHCSSDYDDELPGVSWIEISPDGQYIVGLSCQWEFLESGRRKPRQSWALWDISTPEFHQRILELPFLAFSPKGEIVTLGSVDGEGEKKMRIVQIWDAAYANLQFTTKIQRWASEVLFSKDSKLLVFIHPGDFDAPGPCITYWNLANGELKESKLKTSKSGELFQFALSPDGRFLFSAQKHPPQNEIQLWCTSSGDLLFATSIDPLLRWYMGPVFVVSQDREIIAALFTEEPPIIRKCNAQGDELECGSLVKLLEISGDCPSLKPYIYKEHECPLQFLLDDGDHFMEFSPDGQLLFVICPVRYSGGKIRDFKFKIFSVETGQLLAAMNFDGECGSHEIQSHLSISIEKHYFITYFGFGKILVQPPCIGADRPHWSVVRYLDLDKDWVVYKGKPVLWLPFEYRNHMSSVHENGIFAIGYKSNRFTLIKFDSEY